MMIFNHPVFPSQIDGFSPLAAVFLTRKLRHLRGGALPSSIGFTRLSRKITPNKAEQKSMRNPRALHRGMTGLSGRSSIFDKAEFVALEQPLKGVVMISTICVVGLVILAGFVVVGALAVLLHRAGKEIDGLKFDRERL